MFRPPVDDPELPTMGEYVTTSPFLLNGVLYVSTYIERTRNPSEEKCPGIGDAKLYALDPTTGKGKWSNGKQAVVLSNIKIAGISASSDGSKIVLAIKELKTAAWDDAVSANVDDLTGTTPIAPGVNNADGLGDRIFKNPPRYEVPLIQYWKESF